jgi:hypothetical protein
VYNTAVGIVKEPHTVKGGEEVMPPLNVLADRGWDAMFEILLPFLSEWPMRQKLMVVSL